jgi:IclR family pca regulon transcriptional regulator
VVDVGEPNGRLCIRAAVLLAVQEVVLPQLDQAALARPLLEDLRLQSNCTVSLGILDEDRALYLALLRGSCAGQYAVDLNVGIGSRLPLYCTAIGKALLAHLPDAQQMTLLSQLSLSKHGPNTIASKKTLREALGDIREDGFAVDDQESGPDAQGIAVPVITADGEVPGAIALLAPRSATTVAQLRSVHAAHLLQTAKLLAALLH